MKKRLNKGQDFIELVEKRISILPERDHFGCIFTFGSQEITGDIDLYWSPNPKYKLGETYKIKTEFLRQIKTELKKDYNSDLITFTQISKRGIVEYLSKRNPKQVLNHDLFFSNIEDLFNRAPFTDEVLNSPKFQVIHGSKENLKNEYSPEKIYFYYQLINSNFLLSNFNDEVTSRNIQHVTNYVQKRLIGQEKEGIRILTNKENRKLFYETLAFLDKQAD